MTQPNEAPERAGEILISGVDTGPEDRGSETPTEARVRLYGLDDPESGSQYEPDNEDG